MHSCAIHLSYWQRGKFEQYLEAQIVQKMWIARSQQHDNVDTFHFDSSKTCLRQRFSVLLLPSFNQKGKSSKGQNDNSGLLERKLGCRPFAIMQALTVHAIWGKIVQGTVRKVSVSAFLNTLVLGECMATETSFSTQNCFIALFDQRPSIQAQKELFLIISKWFIYYQTAQHQMIPYLVLCVICVPACLSATSI